MREYNDQFLLKLRDGDREQIERRMKEAGMLNMSAYIRKMAIDGYVIQLDLSDLKEVSRLVRINANNLNQYTRRANETGNIYLEDIKEIREQQEKIWEALKELIRCLAALK